MSSLLHSDPEESSEEAPSGSPSENEFKKALPPSVNSETDIPRNFPKAKKVSVRFSAIGSTSAISPSAFTVAETQTVATISSFLMRKLNLNSVYIYVSNSFQPTPDETLGQLHSMYSTHGVLNFSYCENIAFG